MQKIIKRVRHAAGVTAFCALTFAGVAHASPQIDIGDWYEFLPSGRATLTKHVVSNGDATAFVRVSATEVFARDGYVPTGKSGASPLDQATTGMMVSPGRLIIPQGMRQSVRMLVGGDRTVERYFRVSFVPVVPSEKNNFGLSGEALKSARDNVRAGVAVLTGYGIMVTVAPENARYQTQTTRTPDGWRITNNGNATVRLLNPKTCQGNECHSESAMHIRPGESLPFSSAGGKRYTFTLKEGDKAASQVLKAD